MNQAKVQSVGLLIGRIGIGLIILWYGSGKALGVFGGHGIQGTISDMSNMGISTPFAVMSICAEFLGSIGLILGLLTRVAALGITVNMGVATYMTVRHVDIGDALLTGKVPMVNNVAYPLALSIVGLMFLISGAGDFSIDRKLFGKKRR